MIVTANKYVNARIGRPFTDAPNPSYLNPGDQIVVKNRIFGENIEGCDQWFESDRNEFLTQKGFHLTSEIETLPYDNVPQLFKQLEIYKLWSAANSKGDNISVGIIDMDGVANYSGLTGKVKPLNYNIEQMDPTNHSTYMASIIGGYDTKNGEIGIAPKIDKIYSYQLQSRSLEAKQLLDSLIAMKKAGVNIINMSISSTVFTAEAYSSVNETIKELLSKNVLLISSTGNIPRNEPSFPSSLEGIISVSGFQMNNFNKPDGNSNVWNGVNISAPYDEYFDKSYRGIVGTSNSCAIISGIIACSYKKILNLSTSENVYDYITKNIFPNLRKILYPVNGVNVSLYNTIEFINLLN